MGTNLVNLEKSYFQKNYEEIHFPFDDGQEKGLRRAQLGAIHAIASHFTLRADTGIIVMPTGSGKTAVLMMSCFALRAKRVLIITPSRLVRSQISKDFKNLSVLTRLGVIKNDLEKPKVNEVDGKVGDKSNWEKLSEFDVVIGTPFSLSPSQNGNSNPPEDLFDLILVDEAHHSAARIWVELFQAFPKAKRVLFTATPFRKDQKEIKGQFIYVYPLREAYKDGIFGKIEFISVKEETGVSNDLLIARQAEVLFNKDKADGFKHALMVRTDGIERSEELKKLYADETKLNLKIVNSRHSSKYIEETIQDLRDGKLDGVICVAMLGEGFDFPNLKIAAIHTPHHSLEVTLQFIGRFARTGAKEIGTAKFLAVPSEIEIESEKLYQDDAIWQEIIANLSETKITYEEKVRQALQTFDKPTVSNAATEDISLYSLKPFNHVKIYKVEDPNSFDLKRSLKLPNEYDVVYQNISEAHNTIVFITRETLKPRWTHLELFFRTEYDLFVIYFDKTSKLLFINSSRKNEAVYEALALRFAKKFSKLPLSRIYRVLLDLKNPDFFSIGLKNRTHNSNTESYRTMSGASTQNALDSTDGRLYHQGHVYGRADSLLGKITIGYSSASKVWSNRNTKIPELVEWCQGLALKLSSDKKVITNSGLDILSVGVEVTELPEGVIAADWQASAYKDTPRVTYLKNDGTTAEEQLLDLDLNVDFTASDKASIRFRIKGVGFEWAGLFGFSTDNYFSPLDGRQTDVKVCVGDQEVSLDNYLNMEPLRFYFADFSALEESQHFRYESLVQPFPAAQIEAIDWRSENVDVEAEIKSTQSGKKSIQDYLRDRLVASDCDIVIFDHGTGEVADFITTKETAQEIVFTLFHCKGSGGSEPGDRVDDVYEVCQQVVKSIIWLNSVANLKNKIEDRVKKGSSFAKGDSVAFDCVCKHAAAKKVRFVLGLVQPGVSKSNLSEKLATVMAAADQYVKDNKGDRIFVLGST